MQLRRAYSLAEIPPVWRVLGAKLQPLTPRHIMVMECVGNALSPLQHENAVIGPAMLAQAVEICRRTGKKAARLIRDTPPWRMRLILALRRGHYRWAGAPWQPMAQFASYRFFWYHDRPQANRTRESSRDESEVPGLWSLIAQRATSGEDRERILDTPCRVLLWDAAFNSDAAGMSKVFDETPERKEFKKIVGQPLTQEQIEHLLDLRKQHGRQNIEAKRKSNA